MFEDSLVESRVGQVSSSKRWTMLASIGLQVAVAGVVMVLPLLHPEAMPFRLEAPKVLMPLMPKPPLTVIGSGMRMTDALPGGIVGSGSGPAVSVAPARAPVTPLPVSTGVLQGMLMAPIRPVYPVIAK